jgi:hypothetical protein
MERLQKAHAYFDYLVMTSSFQVPQPRQKRYGSGKGGCRRINVLMQFDVCTDYHFLAAVLNKG